MIEELGNRERKKKEPKDYKNLFRVGEA